jgi:hypothetical protein
MLLISSFELSTVHALIPMIMIPYLYYWLNSLVLLRFFNFLDQNVSRQLSIPSNFILESFSILKHRINILYQAGEHLYWRFDPIEDEHNMTE